MVTQCLLQPVIFSAFHPLFLNREEEILFSAEWEMGYYCPTVAEMIFFLITLQKRMWTTVGNSNLKCIYRIFLPWMLKLQDK